jgi:hypothetical protein
MGWSYAWRWCRVRYPGLVCGDYTGIVRNPKPAVQKLTGFFFFGLPGDGAASSYTVVTGSKHEYAYGEFASLHVTRRYGRRLLPWLYL